MTAAETSAFGDLLRRFRKAAGLTQEELAERAGLSRRGINDLERGARLTPRRETLALLIGALELAPEDRSALLTAARRKLVPSGAETYRPDDHQRQPGDASSSRGHAEATASATPERDEPPVDGAPSLAQAWRGTAVVEERKLVTLLFADVAESSALDESPDPEDVRALMDQFYAHARRVVTTHGGTLVRQVGDAVMAVFGLPRAYGDDAERGVAAALALREAIAGDQLLMERLALRMSVNTGDVVATPDVSGESFAVTGEVVNVTTRLQAYTLPGEILIGARTQMAAAAAFTFGAARSVQVKGQQTQVVPLEGPRAVRLIGRLPLVGRRQELAQLALLRDRALQERQPQFVSLLAPAGTGKTRLLEEFLGLPGSVDGFRLAMARCVPYGQTLTYWPLRGLMVDLLGAPATPARISDIFTAAGYARNDANRLAELALVTLGVEPGETVEREGIFHAWRLLIEALARQAPRIVVFEDLHWASDSLLDLVEHVLRPRTQAALLIVATSRPELLDRRPAWGGGHGNLTALTLYPLSNEHTGELVARLADGIPEATRRQIVERSGGNPFFAIELVRARTLRPGNHARALETMPDTVHEAVLARLDMLSQREREALAVASVVGRAFRVETLQAVLTTFDQAEITWALDGLLSHDLIARMDDGSYTFRHILFREVAYGTLSRAERIRVHAAVAAWLEDFARGRLDEFTELIAFHYREATLLARQSLRPVEPLVDPARARAFLERAGEVAGRAGSFQEARAHLESAIALAPEVEHARLYEKLGDCMQLGDTAIHAYRMAYTCWQKEGANGPLTGARILRKLLLMYMRWPATWAIWPSESELAVLLAEARRLAGASGDTHELWRVRVAEGFCAHNAWAHNVGLPDTPADMDADLKMFLEAAAHFEQWQDWIGFSEALDAYVGGSVLCGAYKDGISGIRRRLRAPGVPATERGDAVNMLAFLHLWSGHYGRCIATSREALARLRPADPVILLGKGPLWAVGAACLNGHWSALDWLLPALQEGWEQAQRDRGMAYLAAGYFTALHIAQAREDQSAAAAAMSMLNQLLAPDWSKGGQALLAAYHTDDPLPLALGASDDVWPYLWMREFRFVCALILMFLSERGVPASDALLSFARERAESEHAEFLRQALVVADAVAAGDDVALAAAIDEVEARGLLPHAARMRVVLAERTGDPAQLDRSRPTLERLGDRQFLRELNAIAAIVR